MVAYVGDALRRSLHAEEAYCGCDQTERQKMPSNITV